MKKRKKLLRNITSWKTTILGTVIVTATLVTKFKYPDSVTWWPEAFVGICLGVVLWLSPDTLVDLIKRFVSGASGSVPQNSCDNGDNEQMVDPGN